ncbi:hypothetical protein [Microbacterium aurantiacum]|uniref:ATP/GTP-binding protein n=1 Tax=Microbacterium aurantiacum TaxID=162393 RepID=A0AAJ2M0D7_9MICO|nr:hypothetical protein [Microbacterium aurantiacum]MDS0246309.1 hypothetical protein [Microbacterium aurantiacum]
MPRSHRRRPEPAGDDESFARLLAGFKRTEMKRGVEWTVQPIAAAQAQKPYVCPGCPNDIVPGTAHVVVWRASGILGDSADLAGRRHWHTHCWRIN